MKNPSLAYPALVMKDEAKSIELRLGGINDPGWKKECEERMHGCRLAARILELYDTHQSVPLPEPPIEGWKPHLA
jgi:hypothetical protein